MKSKLSFILLALCVLLPITASYFGGKLYLTSYLEGYEEFALICCMRSLP
ncbi:MAG: hypothetical protein K2N78_02250 [Oscillospiraceae bacterium]|nr:hypothetical protein [Oscillospiraceae bacterium]